MKAEAKIDAGVCGFRTTVSAASEDGMYVDFDVRTDCEKIRAFADSLAEKSPVNAYEEINPTSESVILETARECLKGCCAGCVVPVGLFKSMQIAAGLALPRSITIEISKE